MFAPHSAPATTSTSVTPDGGARTNLDKLRKQNADRVAAQPDPFDPNPAPGIVPLPLPSSLSFLDYYALAVCVLLFPLGFLVKWLVTLIALPCGVLGVLYNVAQKRSWDRVHGCGFSLLKLVCFPFFVLGGAVAWFWWALVFFVALAAGLPIALVRVLFLCQYRVIANNWELLRPHMGFGVLSYDCTARAMLGQLDRQGFWRFFFIKPVEGGFGSVVAWTPLIKYLWSANPFIYELEVAFICQWSGHHPTLNAHQYKAEVLSMVACSLQDFSDVRLIEGQRFAPHYPYGPTLGAKPNEAVVGVQWLNQDAQLMNLTKSVFRHDDEPMRSLNGKLAIWVVPLQWFAFHFLTAYVEVNVTKWDGIEHPMWAVVPAKSQGWLGRAMFSYCDT